MDLTQFGRVLVRHKWLVIGGVALALVLAFLSMVRVSSKGLAYRQNEVWQSQSTLLLTQAGFPWGRVGGTNTGYPGFSSLTDLYASFANSDDVKQDMVKAGAPKTWKIDASPVQPTTASGDLPLIALSGTAFTPQSAIEATTLGREAFLRYVAAEQQAAAIPTKSRIEIKVLQAAARPTLVQPRKKTLPIIVLLAVVSATIALAFILENVRPKEEPRAEQETARPGVASWPRTSARV